MADKALRTVYLEIAQIKQLKKLSKKTRVPQAEYMREALDLLLKKYQEQL